MIIKYTCYIKSLQIIWTSLATLAFIISTQQATISRNLFFTSTLPMSNSVCITVWVNPSTTNFISRHTSLLYPNLYYSNWLTYLLYSFLFVIEQDNYELPLYLLRVCIDYEIELIENNALFICFILQWPSRVRWHDYMYCIWVFCHSTFQDCYSIFQRK